MWLSTRSHCNLVIADNVEAGNASLMQIENWNGSLFVGTHGFGRMSIRLSSRLCKRCYEKSSISFVVLQWSNISAAC